LEPAKVSETYESAVGAVRETRLMALLGWGQLQAFKARADQFVNTGIAHTAASIEIVKDKENTMEQAGFIGGSALFGYILGAFSRRARLLKKLVYSGTLGGGAGYVCYPEEMTAAANYAAEEGNKLGLIAYNFIAGVQPNGGGGVDSNPEAASAAAVNPSTVEKDVLSEDDKKFLSSSEVIKPATASKQ